MTLPLENRLNLVLKVGFGLVLFLLIGSTVVGLTQMSATNRRTEEIIHRDMKKRELALSATVALYGRLLKLHEMLVTRDPFKQDEEAMEFRRLGVAFYLADHKLRHLADSPDDQRFLQRIQQQAEQAHPYAERIINEIMERKTEQAIKVLRTEAVPRQNALIATLQSYVRLQSQRIRTSEAHTHKAFLLTRTILIAMAALAFVIGLITSIVVMRSVARQAKLLQHQAMYDGLTNLPNRALFSDRFQQAIYHGRRNNQTFALLSLDLNGFKEINDTLGHQAGDHVLQVVADRLRTSLRESDTVARMGGDEFTVLLTNVHGTDGVATVCKKLVRTLDEPIDYGGQQIEASASLGAAVYPDHGEDATDLLRASDVAMYHAKHGQTGYKLYDRKLRDTASNRVVMKHEIRDAIDKHELVLHYQPRIDFRTGMINGVEALVRWNHPRLGLLYPDKFIEQAEESGFIKPLTEYVLREALRQCEKWNDMGLNLAVSVNISAINVQDPKFPAKLAELLAEVKVDAHQLELEITETAVMAEPVRAIECITQLHELGLQVAVDDFGTGYSSMAYLKELMVAKIKIDRSFVRDMANNHGDAVIVRSTVELGHNLGLKVIAEGVENQVVWERLKELGCDDAQGFHMGKPIDADELLTWIRKSPWGLKN